VCSDDGHIAGDGVRVVLGDVLLDRQPEHIFLGVGRGPGIFPDVLGLDDMLLDVKESRHPGDGRGGSPVSGDELSCPSGQRGARSRQSATEALDARKNR